MRELLTAQDDLAHARQIDSICDSFEQSWKSGQRPDLTEYLLHTEVPRSTLFVELVLIDIAYRRRHGEDPTVEEYAERYPDYREALAELSLPSVTGKMQTVALTALFERLGRFELVDRIGEGAFGIVWKAWDTKLERWVALKQFRSMAKHQQAIFDREARAVAQLDHPNIVRVYEVSQLDETGFIIFELVNGPTLARWIRHHWSGLEGTGLPPQEVARVAAQLASGLQAVHERGVIHRDFKPGNVLLDEQGVPKIADFGLARHVDALTTISDEKTLLGTVPYMSPEQCRGKAIDARTDIYSLGVVLYEMLTGQRPFEGTRSELLQKIPQEPPVPPRQIHAGIPASLENICLKALAKEPADRYLTAALMQSDLERFLEGEEIAAERRPLLVRLQRWTRRNILVTTSSLAVMAAASLAAGSLAVMYNSRPPDGRRLVTLATEPAGAKVAFIPLDRITGEPVPEEIIHAHGVSPVRERLAPGHYLVVTYLDDGSGRFHEVYRYVPSPEDGLRGGYGHLFWRDGEQGEAILYRVKIPEASVTEGMAFVEGTTRYRGGIPGSTFAPMEEFGIPSFYLDTTEFPFRHDTSPEDLKSPSHPLTKRGVPDTYAMNVSFDKAMSLAENCGKRLPHEYEFEFAATGRGLHRYPWGQTLPESLEVPEDFGPVGIPAFDRIEFGGMSVYGLCSNVAEWTVSSAIATFPLPLEQRLGPGIDPFRQRIVRGGSMNTIEGHPGISHDSRDPRLSRVTVYVGEVKPGLGFRCVRSVAPRLKPEDFARRLNR